MTVELVRSKRLYASPPYAYAAISPPGSLIHTAGACPLDDRGNTVSPGDVAAQARQCMANLFTTLAEAGVHPTDVVKTTVYVASPTRADLVTAWNEIHAAFAPHDPPSTLLGVALLGYPDQLVEVEAVAAKTAADVIL